MILRISSRWEAKGLWLLAVISDRAGNPSNKELVKKARVAGTAKAGASVSVDLSDDDVRWLLRASRLFDADPDVIGSSEKFGKIYQFGISALRPKLRQMIGESPSAWVILSEAPWRPTVIPGMGGGSQPKASLGVTRSDGGITKKTVNGMARLHPLKAKKEWPEAFSYIPFSPGSGEFADFNGTLHWHGAGESWVWDAKQDAWQLA